MKSWAGLQDQAGARQHKEPLSQPVSFLMTSRTWEQTSIGLDLGVVTSVPAIVTLANIICWTLVMAPKSVTF